MKIRHGFVSNSSSCNFICDITGIVSSGWSWGIEDCGMYGCVNHHRFLKEYLINEKYLGNWTATQKRKNNGFVDFSELPPKFCPICQLQEITPVELALYLKKFQPELYQTISEKIKETFKSHRDFAQQIGSPTPHPSDLDA
jgi:hypothetical protein